MHLPLCRLRTSAFSMSMALRFWGMDLLWPNRTLLPGECTCSRMWNASGEIYNRSSLQPHVSAWDIVFWECGVWVKGGTLEKAPTVDQNIASEPRKEAKEFGYLPGILLPLILKVFLPHSEMFVIRIRPPIQVGRDTSKHYLFCLSACF